MFIYLFVWFVSELMTSVSEKCSQVIVEGNALPVLFTFMEKSNRSRPTLEMVKICLKILNNLTKVNNHTMHIHCDNIIVTVLS